MAAQKNRVFKKAALQKQGTLNPHPKKVVDECFDNSDFFDPMDLVQVKYEMIRRVSKDGKSISEAAALFGFSRPSFYEAQRSLKENGLFGLVPLKRGPRGNHKLKDDVMKYILKELEKNEQLSISSLIKMIQDEFGLKVHRRSLERALSRKKKRAG